jgi:hypothetical protein
MKMDEEWKPPFCRPFAAVFGCLDKRKRERVYFICLAFLGFFPSFDEWGKEEEGYLPVSINGRWMGQIGQSREGRGEGRGGGHALSV